MTEIKTQQHNTIFSAVIATALEATPLSANPAPQTIAVIDSLTDHTGPVTGPVEQNGLTDDLRPTLSGHTDGGEGLVLKIWLNGIQMGSVVSDANGKWSWTPDSDLLVNQEYFVQVSIQDPGSDQMIMSLPEHFYTTPPGGDDLTIPDMATNVTLTDNVKGGIVGLLHDNDFTNDSHAVMAGKATAGDIVRIYDNGMLIGSTTVAADGSWSFKPATALVDGQHALTASVINPNNGAESLSTDAITVTVDTHVSPPVITGAYDETGQQQGLLTSGDATDDGSPKLIGTAEANSTVYIYDSRGGYCYGSAVADSSGNWSFVHPAMIGVGTHADWLAMAVDVAGNSSGFSDHFKLNIVAANQDVIHPDAVTDVTLTDNVAGGIVGQLHTGDVTNDNHAVLSGKATAGDIINVYDKGQLIGSTAVAADGSWSFKPLMPFLDGNHSLTAVVHNPDNNADSTASTAINITVDTYTSTPVITGAIGMVGPDKGALINGDSTEDNQVTLVGTAEAGSTVMICNDNGSYIFGSTVADSGGHWTFIYPSVLPVNNRASWTAHSTDVAGNTSSLSDHFYLTVVPPKPPVITAAYDAVGEQQGHVANGGSTDDLHVTFTGTSEPNATVNIWMNGQNGWHHFLGSVVADSTGHWSYYNATGIITQYYPYHTFPFWATQVNSAGNISGNSAAYYLNVVQSNQDITQPHVWDFNDGTLEGWTLLGANAQGTNVHQHTPGDFRVEFNTASANAHYAGDIMSTQIYVEAGKTYNFSYMFGHNTDITSVDNPYAKANVALTVDGQVIGGYHVDSQASETINGSWTAGTTGMVTLAFHNTTDTGVGNDFWIDNITVKEQSIVSSGHSSAIAGLVNIEHATIGTVNMGADGHNTLALTADDVLNNAQQNVLVADNHHQLVVAGQTGDIVELNITDLNTHEWQSAGQVTSGGMQYEVYQHSGDSLELLVQHGIELHQVS